MSAALCIILLQAAGLAGAAETLRPESTSEVVANSQRPIGGGWAKATATLYRNGLLVIEGQAVSTAAGTATRATINVVGVDRIGNAIFVSKHLDIPTACSKTDPTCSSNRTGSKQEQIPADIAKYVSHLNVHFSERNGPTVYQNLLRNIRETCNAYDELPIVARAAIAIYTSFPGCNPIGLGK